MGAPTYVCWEAPPAPIAILVSQSVANQEVLGSPGKGSSPEFICPPIEDETGWPGADGEVMLLG